MYIESTLKDEDETSRLISPVFERRLNNTCLEFYYHMYKVTSGQLRVYVKETYKPWNLTASEAVFWKIGDQGNRWQRGYIFLGVVILDFQVELAQKTFCELH